MIIPTYVTGLMSYSSHYTCICSLAEPHPGIDIIGQTEVTVDSSGVQPYEWKDYGLRLHVPKGALPNGADGTITIKASLSGQFKLPRHHHLVSAVYEIHSNTDHSSPVTIEIQHCSPPDSISSLSFASIMASTKGPPFKFELHRGGVFSSHSQYGSIAIKQLCSISLLAVVRSVSRLPQFLYKQSLYYCAQLLYICNQPTDWTLHLVMSRDLEAETKVCSIWLCVDLASYPG